MIKFDTPLSANVRENLHGFVAFLIERGDVFTAEPTIGDVCAWVKNYPATIYAHSEGDDVVGNLYGFMGYLTAQDAFIVKPKLDTAVKWARDYFASNFSTN